VLSDAPDGTLELPSDEIAKQNIVIVRNGWNLFSDQLQGREHPFSDNVMVTTLTGLFLVC
jgi:hypothetical protein